MKTKEHIIYGVIFSLWTFLIVSLLAFTWPPTMTFIIVWFIYGILTSAIYILEDYFSYHPSSFKRYLNWIWIVWVIFGAISLLVFISIGWYKYRERKLYRGKTLR